MREIWKDIPGWEGLYQVSNLGRVKSLPKIRRNGTGLIQLKERILRPGKCPTGHLNVNLHLPGKARSIQIHRLVLLAFVGPCPPGMECRHHPDPDPSNNRLDNLSWGTKKDQYKDRIVDGTHVAGSKHPIAKLQETDIPLIRSLRKQGLTFRAIGERFGVTGGTIQLITSGKQWKHVPL